jgi:superfamily II DNA or RNA helicase
VILRPRQRIFVDRCVDALRRHPDTLGVAPTGAGKTVMLSAIAGTFERVLCLQHRDELVTQNRRTFEAVNPGRLTSIYNASVKRWSPATFASVQTLVRHLDEMQTFDLVVVDEAHHAPASTYRKIIGRAFDLNPRARLLGVTATPQRGDGRGLGSVFSNLADQISIGELIGSGHLVMPRAYVMDVGLGDQLASVRRTCSGRGDYDMSAVAELMDVEPVTEAVVRHWREKAGDRRTVVFCATVEHANHVTTAFQSAGVAASCVTGKTPKLDRKRILADLEAGRVQVLVNVAVATEGFDCPPVSCVVLLRPSSFVSTMVQMIGRGLRIAPPAKYPGLQKVDCTVLDFGRSLLTHGGLETMVDLSTHEPGEGGTAPKKACRECGAEVPLGSRECPLCGYQWPQELRETKSLAEFRMVELRLMIEKSPFRWWQYNDRCRVVTAFDVWAVSFEAGGIWHCFAGKMGALHHLASSGSENEAVAAGEDFIRAHGDRSKGGKSADWHDRPPSDGQLRMLQRMTTVPEVADRYEASCALTLRFNRSQIRRALSSWSSNATESVAAGDTTVQCEATEAA